MFIVIYQEIRTTRPAYSSRVAICRAVVFAKLGHEVDMPDELVCKEAS